MCVYMFVYMHMCVTYVGIGVDAPVCTCLYVCDMHTPSFGFLQTWYNMEGYSLEIIKWLIKSWVFTTSWSHHAHLTGVQELFPMTTHLPSSTCKCTGESRATCSWRLASTADAGPALTRNWMASPTTWQDTTWMRDKTVLYESAETKFQSFKLG